MRSGPNSGDPRCTLRGYPRARPGGPRRVRPRSDGPESMSPRRQPRTALPPPRYRHRNIKRLRVLRSLLKSFHPPFLVASGWLAAQAICATPRRKRPDAKVQVGEKYDPGVPRAHNYATQQSNRRYAFRPQIAAGDPRIARSRGRLRPFPGHTLVSRQCPCDASGSDN
jgi:hypothetical protein